MRRNSGWTAKSQSISALPCRPLMMMRLRLKSGWRWKNHCSAFCELRDFKRLEEFLWRMICCVGQRTDNPMYPGLG
jgi:hypothetical protein